MYKTKKIIIDFKEIDHNFCLKGDWVKVENQINKLNNKTAGWGNPKSQLNQLKLFYESGPNVLWITFYGNKLWWCFANPEVYLDEQRKCRDISGSWKSVDIKGKELVFGNLSGKILKTHGYRGTICKVEAKDYLINKINCEKSLEKIEIENKSQNLKANINKLINNLYWDDFEVLVDIVFSKLGWIRAGAIGKTQKDIDLDLINLATGKTAIVQIKSQSNIQEFKEYQKNFQKITADEKYFVINSRNNFLKPIESGDIKVYFSDEIAEFVIKFDLIRWVLNKAN